MAQFGIWRYDENFGLVGKPENLPELFLSEENIWEVDNTTSGQVWKWPVDYAKNPWFTPAIADDFNKAFFYAQDYLHKNRPNNYQKNPDYDARTVMMQTELLSDFFPGPDGENAS